MHRRYKRSKGMRRKKSLKSTNAGPIIALFATVIAVLGVIALVVFVAVPYLLPIMGIDFEPPWEPTPTPTATPRPTPTPHPVTMADPLDLQYEVVLTGLEGYQWFADPYAWGDKLYFTAGKLVDGNVKMDALIRLDMKTSDIERLSTKLEYYSYAFPICNDEWMVYFDSEQNGGGMLRALRLATGEEVAIKRVYVGQPRPQLDGSLVAWMERTGSRMDKLFVCDLNTLETATIRTFTSSAYGQSGVSMQKGELVYAIDGTLETGGDAGEASDINSVLVAEGKTAMFASTAYVHDPLTNGKQWIWRDGLHGTQDNLYWTQDAKPQTLIEGNVIDYGISDTFAAYSKDEEIWVYLFATREKIRITPVAEHAQLLGVSNGVVIWMDVTSREREVMKYARVE